MKQSCWALSCALLVACAGRAEVQSTQVMMDGDVHDPAQEWNAGNRESFEVEPWRPRPRKRAPERDAYAQSGARPFSVRAHVLARSERVQPIVRAAAHAHAVPPDMVNGIIWVESRFEPQARSKKGACGLMQLMPRTGQEVARAIGMRYHPYDPQFNIHAGTYYFARMVERFGGNLMLALAAYNTGPGRVESWMRASEPLPGYSRAYAHHVLSAARAFRSRTP